MFPFALKIKTNSSIFNKSPQGLSSLLFHLSPSSPFVMGVSLKPSYSPIHSSTGLCVWCPPPTMLPPPSVCTCSVLILLSDVPSLATAPSSQIVIKQVCVHVPFTPLDYRHPLCFCPPCCQFLAHNRCSTNMSRVAD